MTLLALPVRPVIIGRIWRCDGCLRSLSSAAWRFGVSGFEEMFRQALIGSPFSCHYLRFSSRLGVSTAYDAAASPASFPHAAVALFTAEVEAGHAQTPPDGHDLRPMGREYLLSPATGLSI